MNKPFYYTAMLKTQFWLVNCGVLQPAIFLLQTVAMLAQTLEEDFNQKFCVKWWIFLVSSCVINVRVFSECVIVVLGPWTGRHIGVFVSPFQGFFTTMTSLPNMIPYLFRIFPHWQTKIFFCHVLFEHFHLYQSSFIYRPWERRRFLSFLLYCDLRKWHLKHEETLCSQIKC